MDIEATRTVMRDAAKQIRSLSAEKTKLASELNALRRREEAREIVIELERRGKGNSGVPVESRVDELLNSGRELDVIKVAMEMDTESLSFASVSATSKSYLSGGNALENYMYNGCNDN